MGRLLAVGDIHGCADTLKALIDKVKPEEGDKFVFLGDYVDRGNKSFETVEYLIKLSKAYDCVFLKGNHENMWLRYLKKEFRVDEYDIFFYNGGQSTLESYCSNMKDLEGNPLKPQHGLDFIDLPKSHQDFYNSLKVYHEEDDFVFVHGGVRPNVPLNAQSEHDMLWIRDTFLRYPSQVMPGKTIVHGHTPMDRYDIEKYNRKYDDKINLDTGAVFGYFLTCKNVKGVEKYQQKMIDIRTS